MQALQQTKLQLEDDIRKASHANEVAETAKTAEQRGVQVEDLVQAEQVEPKQLTQDSMDAETLHGGMRTKAKTLSNVTEGALGVTFCRKWISGES